MSTCSFTHAHHLPPPQSFTMHYRAWRCCIFTASVPLEIPQWQAKMALFAGEGAALNAYGAIFVQSEQNNIKIYPMNATEDAKLRNFVLDCQWLPTLSANLSQ